MRNGIPIDNKDNNILEYLLKKDKLNSKKLQFILKIVKDASLCTIEIIWYCI